MVRLKYVRLDSQEKINAYMISRIILLIVNCR